MKKAILCSTIILVSTSEVLALENKWYAKVGYGVVDPDAGVVEDFVAGRIEEEQGVADEISFTRPKGQSISLGYRLNHYIALEAGHINFGRTADTHEYIRPYGALDADGIEGTVVATYKSKISGSTETLALVLSTDSSETFSAGIKLGYHFWDTKARVDYFKADSGRARNSEGEISEFSSSESARILSADGHGEDAFYGAFANWRIDQWAYALEYTLLPTDEADIALSAISLSMDF